MSTTMARTPVSEQCLNFKSPDWLCRRGKGHEGPCALEPAPVAQRVDVSSLIRDIGKLNLFAAALTLYVVFNGFDLFSTLFMVGAGLAREINPFMKWIWTFGTPAFIAMKVIATLATAKILWTARFHRLAQWTLAVGLAVYTLLILQQVYMMFHALPYIRACLR